MIKIVCVGKIKEKYLFDAINDYLTRLTKYHKVEIIELKDSDIQKEKESILSVINKNDYIISMAIEGKEYSSLELHSKIENLLINGKSNITFIIGGSDGIHKEIKEISNELMSFSKLTFPHGIFRLLLLEQLYRIFKIENGESYHK